MDSRLTEQELQKKVDIVLPRVFGSLLTALSKGISNLPTVKPLALPRMADFAKWAMSVETALGFEAGCFMQAYELNRAIGHEEVLEASPVAIAVQRLMTSRDIWKGSATELLKELEKFTDEKTVKSRSWSSSSKSLGKIIARIAPDLRGIGITVHQYKGTNGKRFIELEKQVKLTPQTPLMPQTSDNDEFF